MKIGVLGGTFDPIHNGHIAIAEETRSSLDLTEVIFIPAAQSPLKSEESILAAEFRVEMVRLAISGHPGFSLSRLEVDRPGLSFTVDTIRELRKGLGAADELYFIIGWDGLAQFHRWREPARIIEMCRLVTVPRPGYAQPALETLEAGLPGITGRLTLMDRPEVNISATEIRERVLKGLSIDRLVPAPVAEYITKNKLYLS